MTELIQLAPTLAIPLVIVAASMLLLREVRKLTPNGKLDDVARRIDGVEERLRLVDEGLDSVREDVAYIRGKLDAAAENTGRHAPLTIVGGANPP